MKTPSAEGATPAMAQWFALKSEQPDALLFFRMGDFYELFFADAHAAAAALDISLTHRGTHAGQPIPMCGVPYHAASAYLARLIRRGFRVAVSEQTEAARKPGQPGPKGPLARAIVRVISPGTLIEDELLEAGRHNLLLAIAQRPKGRGHRGPSPFGAAWIDISTGVFETALVPEHGLSDLLGRLDPAEILAPPGLELGDFAARLAPEMPPSAADKARRRVAEAFEAASLDAFGDFSDEEAVAAGVALDYIRQSQAGKMPRLASPRRQDDGAILGLDPATRASLDILRARDGGSEHTLFVSVDRTVTSAGARMLAQWLSAPLTDAARITSRQRGWLWLIESPTLCDALSDTLRRTPDMDRALGRLSLGRGQPRDAAAIGAALASARIVATLLQADAASPLPPDMAEAIRSLHADARDLESLLARALNPEPPARLEDGNVIAEGFDTALDEERALCTDSRRVIAALQARYAEAFGLNSLKIRHHAQLGYIIEVPIAAADRLRDHPDVTLRQGTASLARFSTDELVGLDRRITEAAERAATMERQIFSRIVASILSEPALAAIARGLGMLDVLNGCAALAAGGRWCCPTLTDDQAFELVACRHPVVEAALSGSSVFTPNGCDLSPDRRVMLLTGPNMAGKSTFLRQTALAVILAQAGLPVPADSARLGIVDRLFSRVGAADDLARGRSTFMVEMTETAAILNQAGPRSMVVVDEIGRGTATLDGLAIAWATLEALHSTLRCRTIFATHFHELAELAETLPRLSPHTMAVRDWKGRIVFAHQVVAGSARRSWGVHVARLAGVPETVVQRATRLLAALEKEHEKARAPLPLFDIGGDAPPAIAEQADVPDAVRAALLAIDPDSLSPREALQALYDLRKLTLEDGSTLTRS